MARRSRYSLKKHRRKYRQLSRYGSIFTKKLKVGDVVIVKTRRHGAYGRVGKIFRKTKIDGRNAFAVRDLNGTYFVRVKDLRKLNKREKKEIDLRQFSSRTLNYWSGKFGKRKSRKNKKDWYTRMYYY